MDKLPQYADIENAYRAVEEIVKKMPESNWTGRALENLKVSEGAAYQARERAGADERVTAMATGGLVSADQPYLVGERGPEETFTACSGGSINIIKES